jgi:DNA-binding IscR family transcriptional regulator
MNECFMAPSVCQRAGFCPVRMRLSEVQIELNARLAETTIADVVRQLASEERAVR